jgi:beta-glucosidase
MLIRVISSHRCSLRPRRFRGIVAVILLSFTSGFSPAQQVHPNAQLADPKIEAKIDALLQQMTLEEKVGQLVQYGGQAVAPPPAPGKKKRGSRRHQS